LGERVRDRNPPPNPRRRYRWLLALAVLAGCGQLDYNRLGIHDAVVTGGQAQIDAGDVVDVDGLPGIWLAGHRTTHGAVFHALPGARVGDQVCVYGKCYTVTRIIYWPSHANPGYLGPLVLQTSLPGSGVLLVVAS
jgi:hypothetical protein